MNFDSSPTTYFYSCPACWNWVFEKSIQNQNSIVVGQSSTFQKVRINELPSLRDLMKTPNKDRKMKRSLASHPGILRIETDSEQVWFSGNGFNSLGEKDLLVGLLEMNGVADCSPPSICVPWNTVDENNFNFPNSIGSSNVFVLKPPLGCQGEGIEFITTKQEVLKIIAGDAQRARAEPGFLQSIEEQKGRIPSWVIQGYVQTKLVSQNRKFHLRAYIVSCSKSKQIWKYNDFEVRVACDEYCEDSFANRKSHITNGAGGDDTHRCMIDELPELENVREVLDYFLNKLFGGKLRNELFKKSENNFIPVSPTKEYSFAALDIMIDENLRPWLLEVNSRCPACPKENMGSERFQAHLVTLVESILKFPSTNFNLINSV